MKIPRFDPPANVQDFKTDQQRQGWSTRIDGFFRKAIKGVEKFPGVKSQFYNPRTTDTDAPAVEKLIEWPGFPKLVQDAFPGDRRKAWETAEATPEARSEYQDEYLEWNVIRNAQGKITRVSFTCEGPEYWDFLAETDPDTLLSLYRGLVNPAHRDEVKLADLIAGGEYVRTNRWNSEFGAVHLTQPNNSLEAEIKIAADATVLRQRNGKPVTDSDQLIRCAGYGAPGRFSDPRIGSDVNTLARAGYSITLRNPVGLYITSYGNQGWTRPNGKPVGNWWKVVRGAPAPGPNKPATVLHLVYEVPAAEGFVVGDIRINNQPIEFGGQMAEFVRVGLVGVACRKGQSNNPAQACQGA